ncbi:Pleckstrin y domain [Balamuthia mandrillaris]
MSDTETSDSPETATNNSVKDKREMGLSDSSVPVKQRVFPTPGSPLTRSASHLSSITSSAVRPPPSRLQSKKNFSEYARKLDLILHDPNDIIDPKDHRQHPLVSPRGKSSMTALKDAKAAASHEATSGSTRTRMVTINSFPAIEDKKRTFTAISTLSSSKAEDLFTGNDFNREAFELFGYKPVFFGQLQDSEAFSSHLTSTSSSFSALSPNTLAALKRLVERTDEASFTRYRYKSEGAKSELLLGRISLEMRHPLCGVTLDEHKKGYKKSFISTQATEWLIHRLQLDDSAQAVNLLSKLFEHGAFQQLGNLHTQTGGVASTSTATKRVLCTFPKKIPRHLLLPLHDTFTVRRTTTSSAYNNKTKKNKSSQKKTGSNKSYPSLHEVEATTPLFSLPAASTGTEVIGNSSNMLNISNTATLTPNSTTTSKSTKQYNNERWIRSEELQWVERIAEGGDSLVYQGRWDGGVVAIKQMKGYEDIEAMERGSRGKQHKIRKMGMKKGSSGSGGGGSGSKSKSKAVCSNDLLAIADSWEQFANEIRILSGVKHQNIVELKGVCKEPFAIVLEWLPMGSLYDFIHKSTSPFSWHIVFKLAKDICRGLVFLHGQGIIHRDLKSPNILLGWEGELIAKIADFGLSELTGASEQLKNNTPLPSSSSATTPMTHHVSLSALKRRPRTDSDPPSQAPPHRYNGSPCPAPRGDSIRLKRRDTPPSREAAILFLSKEEPTEKEKRESRTYNDRLAAALQQADDFRIKYEQSQQELLLTRAELASTQALLRQLQAQIANDASSQQPQRHQPQQMKKMKKEEKGDEVQPPIKEAGDEDVAPVEDRPRPRSGSVDSVTPNVVEDKAVSTSSPFADTSLSTSGGHTTRVHKGERYKRLAEAKKVLSQEPLSLPPTSIPNNTTSDTTTNNKEGSISSDASQQQYEKKTHRRSLSSTDSQAHSLILPHTCNNKEVENDINKEEMSQQPFPNAMLQPTPRTLKRVGRKVDNPVWLAPEMIAAEMSGQSEDALLAAVAKTVDIYSFGVILWELITRENYFGEVRFMSQIEDMVLEGKRPDIPKRCPPQLAKLVQDCWHGSPSQRPTAEQVLERLSAIPMPPRQSTLVTAAASPRSVTISASSLPTRDAP